MKLKYIILPFKTKEERENMLEDWVSAFSSYPHYEVLLNQGRDIDVNDDNTLSGAFSSVLKGCDFFQGYIKFVDFYLNVESIVGGHSLDKNKPIGEIFAKYRTGISIDIFIAINLEKVELELEIAKRRLTLAKSLLRGDTSLLNILPLELIINISHHIHEILELKNNQGGGAKYNKNHKKEYNSKKRKSKRKKRKSKKRKKCKSKKLSKRR